MSKNIQAKRGRRRRFLMHRAGNLWLLGVSILLISVLGVAIRWHSALQAGTVGLMLIAGEEVEYLLAGLTVLTGGTLLLDYMERTKDKK